MTLGLDEWLLLSPERLRWLAPEANPSDTWIWVHPTNETELTHNVVKRTDYKMHECIVAHEGTRRPANASADATLIRRDRHNTNSNRNASANSNATQGTQHTPYAARHSHAHCTFACSTQVRAASCRPNCRKHNSCVVRAGCRTTDGTSVHARMYYGWRATHTRQGRPAPCTTVTTPRCEHHTSTSPRK